MHFISEGLSYALETHTKATWSYDLEMLLESPASRQIESTFPFTTGVKSPKRVFIYFQQANTCTVNDQEHFRNQTCKINPNNARCFFQSTRLEVGNHIYYPKLEYSSADTAML